MEYGDVIEISISIKIAAKDADLERRVIFLRPDKIKELLQEDCSVGDFLKSIVKPKG